MRRLVLLVLLVLSELPAGWVPVGPDGGNVLTLGADYSTPGVLYCVPYEYPAFSRLFRTSNRGEEWNSVGTLPDYSATDLAVDRFQPQTIYALARGSGVLRSTDGGVRWDSVRLPGYGQALGSDPHVPGRVMCAGYVISGAARAAVFVSTDFGRNWQARILGPDTNYAYCIAFDPLNPGVAYAGCFRGKVFRTSDGGGTWELRNRGLPSQTSLTCLSVNAGNPQILVTGAADGVYRTTDAGLNWSRINSLARVYALEFSPAGGELGYLIGYDTEARVFVSRDSGASWEAQPGGVNLGRANVLLADPDSADAIYVCGGSGVLHSGDQGVSWVSRSAGLRLSRIPVVAVAPWARRRVYVEAEENGVFKSETGGSDWARCADFLSCGSICGIGLAPGPIYDVIWALEGMG